MLPWKPPRLRKCIVLLKKTLRETISSDVFRNHARSTTARMLLTWRDTMWRWDGCSLMQSCKKQRLHPHSSGLLSHLPTCGADKRHANNYMSCESTTSTRNPSWLHPWHPQIFRKISLTGVTFSLVLSLIVFWLYRARGICCVVANAQGHGVAVPTQTRGTCRLTCQSCCLG